MVGFPNESTPKRKQEGAALRRRFIDHLTLRGRARRTIEGYVGWVRRLAVFHRRAPDRLSEKEVREFLLDLHRRRRAFSTINQAVNALRSFYGGLLGWEELSLKGCLPRPGSAKKAPRAYSPKQVDSLLRAAKDYDMKQSRQHPALSIETGPAPGQGRSAPSQDETRSQCPVTARNVASRAPAPALGNPRPAPRAGNHTAKRQMDIDCTEAIGYFAPLMKSSETPESKRRAAQSNRNVS